MSVNREGLEKLVRKIRGAVTAIEAHGDMGEGESLLGNLRSLKIIEGACSEMDAEHLQYERDEARSELERERRWRLADSKLPRSEEAAEPEPSLRNAMERLAKSYCDEAVRYRAAEIEPQIYLEEAASDIRAQIALARTPPQKEGNHDH